jgi:hypothetical protein
MPFRDCVVGDEVTVEESTVNLRTALATEENW